LTKEQEDADCERIMVKGYSPLRRWLRQERARTFEDDLPPPPESRPFNAHFTVMAWYPR
jgi:hypothetical protein